MQLALAEMPCSMRNLSSDYALLHFRPISVNAAHLSFLSADTWKVRVLNIVNNMWRQICNAVSVTISFKTHHIF